MIPGWGVGARSVLLRRRSFWVVVLGIVVPFAAMVGAAHLVLPGLRDRILRRPVASGGPAMLVEEVGSVRLYFAETLDPAACRPLARRLERFCGLLVERWGGDLGLRPLPPPVLLQVFASREDLVRAHHRRYREDFANLGGFYDPGERLVAVAAGPNGRVEPGVILHEAAHLMMDVAGAETAQVPPWLAEGLATYLAASRIDARDGPVLGGLDPALASLASRQGLPPLRELLAAGGGPFRGPDNGRYYAAAHLLVVFLVTSDQGKYRGGFLRFYREAHRTGSPDPGLLYWTLGVDPRALDRAWRGFVASLGTGR